MEAEQHEGRQCHGSAYECWRHVWFEPVARSCRAHLGVENEDLLQGEDRRCRQSSMVFEKAVVPCCQRVQAHCLTWLGEAVKLVFRSMFSPDNNLLSPDILNLQPGADVVLCSESWWPSSSHFVWCPGQNCHAGTAAGCKMMSETR